MTRDFQSEKQWDDFYRTLVKFKIENNHVQVQPNNEDNKKLWVWINEQKKAFKAGKLEDCKEYLSKKNN